MARYLSTHLLCPRFEGNAATPCRFTAGSEAPRGIGGGVRFGLGDGPWYSTWTGTTIRDVRAWVAADVRCNLHNIAPEVYGRWNTYRDNLRRVQDRNTAIPPSRAHAV